MMQNLSKVYENLKNEKVILQAGLMRLNNDLNENSSEISPDQVSAMHRQATAMGSYVVALSDRMDCLEKEIRSERRKEHRWNVIIAQDEGEDQPYTAYGNFDNGLMADDDLDKYELRRDVYIFSDEDFERLVSMLRLKPNGDRLAKIAELGKVPVPEVGE